MSGDTKGLDIEHDNGSLFQPMSGTVEGRWRDLEEPRSSDEAKGANKAEQSHFWYTSNFSLIFPIIFVTTPCSVHGWL
jgi:hypothetical protein